MPGAYEQAGVKVEAGYELIERIKTHTTRTARPGAGQSVGFGCLFDISSL